MESIREHFAGQLELLVDLLQIYASRLKVADSALHHS